jgi:prefoldin subunit 5
MVNGLVQSIYVDGLPVPRSEFSSYDKTIKEIRTMQAERLENLKKDTSQSNNDAITYLEKKLQNLKKAQKKTNIN